MEYGRAISKQRLDFSAIDNELGVDDWDVMEKSFLLKLLASEKNRVPNNFRDNFDAYIMDCKTSVVEGEDTGGDVNVKDITVNSFCVSVRGLEFLKNASFIISHGKRYGLVGSNRLWKSTILKLLALRKIPVPKNIDILLVDKELVGDEKSVLEAVVSANEEDLAVAMQMLGSDAAEAHASKILAGLGFTKDMQVRPTKSFNGGWRTRISLARALFLRPTLLLLDQPTNHLDLRSVLWLEEYLCRWKNTLIVVSHAVDLLNTVCTDIIHLHEKNLHMYHGNLDAFEMNKKFEILEKEASKRKAKDEEGLVPTVLPRPLVQLIEVSFCYPNIPDFRLSKVQVAIDMGTRVAIVGPNGAGKSTLLNLVAGDLVPTEGEVRRSENLRIMRYSQHFVDQLTREDSPLEYLLRLHPHQREAARAKLVKFGLPSRKNMTPFALLQEQEKAMVVLASISMSNPDILLFDEPTNHLDMEAVDMLADALHGFIGVVLVSHDSRLISRVCEEEEKSKIWVVEDGTVTFFQGTFEEYKEQVKRQIKAEFCELTSLVSF